MPIEPEPRLDAAVVMPPDAAVVAPPDAAVVVKPDAAVVVPPDAAIVVPPPDAALPKLDAPLAPDAAPVDRGCGADPDLLLCLDFDDGMASDKSALALNLNTSALGFESGPTGLALRSTTSTRIANLNTTQLTLASEVTIEAWIKPDRLPAVGARFGVLDYQPQYSLFLLPNGALSCGCDSFNFVMTAPIIAPAVWHSVACTLDANAVTIWVNGVAAATKSIPGLCRAGATAAGVSVLGNVPDNNTTARESLVGVSDNVRVWSRALTAAEICSDALVCL